MKISILGLGYIGLPTAAVAASSGMTVIGVDVNQHAVDTINRGSIHIEEPGLEALVYEVVVAGRLRATTVVEPADAFLIAVPTPLRGNHVPDMCFVETATASIASVLTPGNVVILESTSPVGTTAALVAQLSSLRPDLRFPKDGYENTAQVDVHVAYCPERVLPGRVLHELVYNDRIIGGMSAECSSRAITVYQHFVKGACIPTTSATAELCKLAENSYRDVNIAFANELSMIADRLDVDVWELVQLANRHPRVSILQPGPGVGGHCIAVDPWFIVHSCPAESRLIATARQVNDSKAHWVLDKITAALNNLQRKPGAAVPCVALFGLAFKPNVDDLRESPAVEIASLLAKRQDCTIVAVEPHIDTLPAHLAKAGLDLMSYDEALKRANIAVLLVDHDNFQGHPVPTCPYIDTRGLWK